MDREGDDRFGRLLVLAKQRGEEHVAVLDRVGEAGIIALLERVQQRFYSDEGMRLTDAECLTAIYRYYSALEDRELSPLELDKVVRLFFVLYRMQDSLTAALQDIMLSPTALAEDAKGQIDRLTALRERLEQMEVTFGHVSARIEGLHDELYGKEVVPVDTVVNLIRTIEAHMKDFSDLWGDFVPLSGRVVMALQEVVWKQGQVVLEPVDKRRIDTIHKTLDVMGKQIAEVENELGLGVKRGEASVADRIRQLLAKVDRYRQTHPELYTWVCPSCDWQGLLCRKIRPEGSLINALDLCWTWCCPSCGVVIAYDQQHPYFDGKILFSHRMWEKVVEGILSFKDMAYFLHTSPEYIIWAVRNVLRLELPDHVKEEWEQYDSQSRDQGTDDN